jgi:phosphocarrier protein HPr
MPERDVEVVNAHGIHARPAAEIVKLAAKFGSQITLARDGMEVNGKSIMGVMMLAAECGSTVRIKAEGADADKALDALSTLIASRFGEH